MECGVFPALSTASLTAAVAAIVWTQYGFLYEKKYNYQKSIKNTATTTIPHGVNVVYRVIPEPH